MTTRGMRAGEFKRIGNWIADVLENPTDEVAIRRVGDAVNELCDEFPLYPEFRGEHARV
jgi:glycine hydroxymethyltransferase